MDVFLEQLAHMPATSAPNYPLILITLAVGAVLSLLLRWHFMKFSSGFSPRHQLGDVFPFIILVLAMLIMLVKTSLALSLGVFGALSMVRFRTPIHDPEDMAYLFMAIAIGVGLGAGQLEVTCLGAGAILLFVAFFFSCVRKISTHAQGLLSLSLPAGSDALPQIEAELFRQPKIKIALRRAESNDLRQTAVFHIHTSDIMSLNSFLASAKKQHPTLETVLINQDYPMLD